MDKIGIVTITSSLSNYGGLLQQYAVQRLLASLGKDAERIVDTRYGKDCRKLSTYYKSLIHYVTRIKYSPGLHRFNLACFFWAKKYLKTCPIVIRKTEDEKKLLDRFDGFLVGSDMVWNPYCPWDSSDLAFLEFAPAELRVAYAVSLGVNHIPENRVQEYADKLTSFMSISMREKQGALLIESLTQRKVETLVDPTIVLPVKEWDAISSKSPEHRYILVYVLGQIPPDYQDYLSRLSLDLNCPLIDIRHNEKFSGGSPSDFIGLIRGSVAVVTDSFHGAVFSLIYHKRLTILKRSDSNNYDMFVRIQNLFEVFDLHPVENRGIIEVTTDESTIDKIIELESRRSIAFLKKNLI